MASNADSLYGIAAELLAKSAAILAALPQGAPANQYVAHGPPAYDCPDSLIVNTGALGYFDYTRGLNARNDPKMPVVLVAPLSVTVLRCVNEQAMPAGGAAIRNAKISAIQADAQRIYSDGWALFVGINQAYDDGSLFAGHPCRPFEISQALPISPEGGALGWQIDVIVQLDGYDVAGA